MTKKHFNELAAIMKRNKLYLSRASHWTICEELASFCARHNPNFNRSKFLAACGVE